MRRILWLPALLVGVSVAWAGGEPTRQGGTPATDPIDQLIKKLNSDKFADRERASAELEKLGEKAYDALKKAAAAKDVSQETRSRAEKILAKVGQKVEAATVLAPTKLRLECKDTPVAEAVKQLAQKSGYPIVLSGDQSKLADRKVTFDTGETTFWQAFDRLCKEGGLVQATNPHGNIRFGNPPGINPNGPIQIQPVPLPIIQPALPGKGVGVAVPNQAVPAPPQRNNQAANVGPAAVAVPQVAVVQAVAVPAQVVPQPAIGPLPPQIGPPVMPGQVGQIQLVDGKAEDYPTHYAGAVRFRLVPYDRNTMSWIPAKTQGETLLILEVCAEPKLANVHVSGSPRVDKAVDDQGQNLGTAADPANAPPGAPGVIGAPPVARRGGVVMMPQPGFNPYVGLNRVLVPVRLKLGEKQAKALKELAGSVTVECLTPEHELAAINDVLKAAGKSAKAKDGGSLELVEIAKQDNGDVRVRVRMDQPPNGFGVGGAVIQVMPGGAVRQQIQIGGPVGMMRAPGMPSLLDAKGKAFQLTQIQQQGRMVINNVFTHEMTLLYRPQAGQGEAARLVLTGRRNAIVPAAFRFENVPLP